MNIELKAGKFGISGAIRVVAYVDDEYAGSELFYGYTKREALSEAKKTIKTRGGLGVYKDTIREA